ncbi:MAG TPA: hypothetical protein VHS56_13720 [Candidatus Cybelea sp.]|nr:hypothetical protein [Candidatus Cybelea sp.]
MIAEVEYARGRTIEQIAVVCATPGDIGRAAVLEGYATLEAARIRRSATTALAVERSLS